jgi:hypothetical protein
MTVNHHVADRNAPVICFCGRQVERRSRQQRFCSAACRKRDAYAEKVRTGVFSASSGTDTRLGTNPLEKANGFNGLQGAKSGSSPSICAPGYVLELEITEGRQWSEVTSPEGVVCMVASLRHGTLKRAA